MSTNLTENFGLHTWEPGDDFLREEFNANFEAIDQAALLSAGAYTGNGAAEQTIELGFTPRAVFVLNDSSGLGSYQAIYGGLATPDCPLVSELESKAVALSVTEGGFKVYTYVRISSTIVRTNQTGQFHYLALR